MIDADVHCAPASLDALRPHLSDYWWEYIDGAGIRLTGMQTAYPPAATKGPPPSSYHELREQVLDPDGASHVVLNCMTLCEAHRNPYYQAALASALNDWLTGEFLDRDERLRASLVVPAADTEAAVAEIERLGGDRRFVQVLLPVRSDEPYGRKRYHGILEAAAEHDLAIGLHAWGRPGQAPTPSGFTKTYLEDYLSNGQIAQTQLLSLVSEGVFERWPALRVSLMECGFAWLPPFLWRFDKDWRGVWREVPWVKEKPSHYIRRHFKATTAPAHLPSDREHVRELVQMIGSDWLMHASDHPHEHGDSARVLYDVLDGQARQAVDAGNAAHFLKL